MAILKIARMGHPVLRRRADPVADPTAPEITVLVEDMIDTLEDAGGVGLAAPQVHVPLQVMIFDVPRERQTERDGETPEGLRVLINPVIEPVGDEHVGDWEGCLSIPDMVGYVKRPARIRYCGLDLAGKQITCIADGFHARVVQHECDHLWGRLYPSRIEDFSLFGFSDEIRRDPPPTEPDPQPAPQPATESVKERQQ